MKKGLSAPAQRADISDYVQRNQLSGLRFYEEPKAVKGETPFQKRIAGKRLIADIRNGIISHIVVRDMDRLTRDVPLWLQLNQLCFDSEVTIHTLSGPLYNSSPTDRFATTVRAAASQLEKEQVGDRVRRVKRQMARNGKHSGGPPPFGYISQTNYKNQLISLGMTEEDAKLKAETQYPLMGHLYVRDSEAEVVKKIFELYAAKRIGCRTICNGLNRLGLRRRSGRYWHPDKVRRIINDPIVAGFMPHDEVRYAKGRGKHTPKHAQKLYKGKHEAIISEELWRKAQEIKKSNISKISKRGCGGYANRKYALSGLLKCKCGSAMTATATRADKSYGYYTCRKRKYYGPDSINGCSFPRINTGKVHEVFWDKLNELICGPKLVDRVYQAAKKIIADQNRVETREKSGPSITKIEQDIKIWYERHDNADSKIEKDLSWKRIIELQSKIEELKRKSPKPEKKEARLNITKTTVQQYLESISRLVDKSDDRGKAFVHSIVDHHGLSVQMKDERTVEVSLNLRPPGTESDSGTKYAVGLNGEARLKKDKISAWVDENQGKHKCKCGCGKTIPVLRERYWRGIPKYHPDCRYKAMVKKRAELSEGYYTGMEAAKKLGIGRTTLSRWIKVGKLPMPQKSISGMLLFEKNTISQFYD